MSFGGDFFDDKWNPIFNSEVGKASADYLVTTLKQNAPPAWSSSGAISRAPPCWAVMPA